MIPNEDPNYPRTSPPWRHYPITEDQEAIDMMLGDVGVSLDALCTEYIAQGYSKESSTPGRPESTFKEFVVGWVSRYLVGKGA